MRIGWNIVIETTNGNVGLWTCWLGDKIALYYPKEFKGVSDELIMDTLDVKLAEPVYNENMGTRLWARYYSERLSDVGRVWIDHVNDCSDAHHLNMIKDNELTKYSGGHCLTNTIFTFPFHFCMEEEPDAPNTKKENIQAYNEKFIILLVKIAKLLGDIVAVNIDSEDDFYSPEILDKKGYCFPRIRYRKNVEHCYVNDKVNGFELFLKSGGNSFVRWTTIIRYPSTNKLTSQCLIDFLDKFEDSEKTEKPIPVITYFEE